MERQRRSVKRLGFGRPPVALVVCGEHADRREVCGVDFERLPVEVERFPRELPSKQRVCERESVCVCVLEREREREIERERKGGGSLTKSPLSSDDASPTDSWHSMPVA